MPFHECPTVRVKSDDPEHGGFIVINESDFDAAKHVKVDTPVPPPPPVPLPPPPPGVSDPLAALGKDWQGKDATELRQIAAAVSGRAVENKAQAIAVIEAALAKSAT
jgi:hypothetical protein